MPYWENVTRSFQIAWRHRYLWLLALFAGEGGGASFNYSQGSRTAPNNANPSAAAQQFGTWLGDHLWVIAVVSVLILIVAVAAFILAAVCEGALIRAAAEHDAERPFGLGTAWRAGLHTTWLIVRFRLLLLLLALPAALLFALLVGVFVLALVANNVTLAVIVGLFGLLVLLGAIAYFIYLSLLDRLGSRTAILEQQPAWASIVRGHRLLVRRFGRVLLVWLISIGVGIAVGIVSAIALVVVALPAIISIIVVLAGGPAWLWAVVALGAILFLVVAIPVGAFLGAQASTYWTLSFRRLDLDYAPSFGPAAMPPAPA